MLFSIKWLSKSLPNIKGEIREDIMIEHVLTDSRVKANHTLFIPIVGESFDGHKFLLQAIENGAVAAIWQEDKSLPTSLPNDFPIFLVEDTINALQEIAASYRTEINPTVVGITGSNGKTTTKDIVAAVCGEAFKTHKTAGNFNNHIGLPLTILSMPRDTEILVLEMGMNHFKEIERLSEIARPDYAIITNIGESHIEFLGSRDGIAQAKLEITHCLSEDGKLIIDGDEPLIRVHNTFNRTLSCGFKAENDLVISDVKISQTDTKFKLSDGKSYELGLIGKHHAKNASFAICLGKLLHIKAEKIQQGLRNMRLTAMRFEFLAGKNGATIINDAYNASPTSMKASIDVLKQMTGFKQKVLVLGDIFELGDYKEVMHRSVATAIDESIDAVLTLGVDARYIYEALSETNKQIYTKHFSERDELLHDIEEFLQADTLILFKASRGMEFENLVKSVL